MAMDKQAELHSLVMRLQRDRMEELSIWMLEAEGKMTSLATAPQTREQLGEQVEHQEGLLEELEQQQATVSSISNFILVDTEDTQGLEEELARLGERWSALW